MAGPERSPLSSLLGLCLVIAMVAGACASSAPQPLDPPAGTTDSASIAEPEAARPIEVEAPPEQVVEVPELPRPIEPDPFEPPPVEPEPEPDDSSVVMIDTGARDVTQPTETLAGAARAERERRQVAEPTGIVITDETLSDYATGDLTTVTPSPAAQAAKESASDLQKEMAGKEAFWRDGVREIRQAWRDAYDRIPELEEKVFELRQAFYREDNGFYRDGEIKPAWDRAIEQLEQAHLEVEERQVELVAFVEEGRAAGALPGWLREGIELEPEEKIVVDSTAEPGEPVIYQQEADDPP